MRSKLFIPIALLITLFTYSARPVHAGPKAPELIGTAVDWINTDGKALKLYGPDGVLSDGHHIVLVDFWEYTCINCIRTFPYVKAWANLYKDDGLIVIGIHTPEFTFAHERANVAAAVKRFGFTYPVLVDSAYKNWSAYDNQEWPADYLLDPTGQVVEFHAGEGNYAETEAAIRAQLAKANPGVTLPAPYVAKDEAMPQIPGFNDMTPELYTGSIKGALGNPEGYHDNQAFNYTDPTPDLHEDGFFLLQGDWITTQEFIQHQGVKNTDYVALRYHARDAVAVIKPDHDGTFKVYVTQDGQPVDRQDAGSDLQYESDGRSYLMVDAPREYQIIHNAAFGAHELKLWVTSPDFRIYSFDFAPT
jgi:thiol-disulfide isomerase/thioredoxin